jgi:hypothetical protein
VTVDNITLDELLAEFNLRPEALDGYHTRAEWASLLRVGQPRLVAIMTAAKAQGRLDVRWERREGLDLRMAKVPVYRFEVGTR